MSRAQYMKKLHVQERAVEEVKLAIKPFYQKREVTKDEYKDILRKAVQKVGGKQSRALPLTWACRVSEQRKVLWPWVMQPWQRGTSWVLGKGQRCRGLGQYPRYLIS